MSSIRDQIVDAIVVTLNTGRPAAVPEFERLKTIAINLESLPTAMVYHSVEMVEPASNRVSPLTKRTLTLVIELRTAEPEPDKSLDPALIWITARLNNKRIVDGSLVELSHEALEQAIRWRVAARENPHMAVTVELEIPYTTRATNQEAMS